MKKLFALLLCAFISTSSVGSPYATTSSEKQAYPGTYPDGQAENDTPPAEGQQPLNTPAPDAEEEFDDKDETSKEKVLQRITTVRLTSFLEVLYQRQLLVFDEHQPEVDTPPPKF